jgi:hypothetical protein
LPKQKRSLNFEIIESNLAEAAEQLEKLRTLASSGKLSEEELQIGLLHAYHHANFSWNISYVSTAKYASLTQRQFKRWGRYPAKIERL